ncbi:MAG: hypothetical protein CMJ18_08610 [Phycisphaeraceae bacterium]|nr:hypothetical protein [Phycisphaeraceae bacterium]
MPYETSSGSSYPLIDAFLDRLLRGEITDLESFLEAHPELPDQQRDWMRALADPGAVGPRPNAPHDGGDDRRVGPYRLLREIGRGGQAVVYLARDLRLGRRVALKVLSTPWPLDGARRLRREAEAASRIDDPALCAVYEVGVDGPLSYIAMRCGASTLLSCCPIGHLGPKGGVSGVFEDARAPSMRLQNALGTHPK